MEEVNDTAQGGGGVCKKEEQKRIRKGRQWQVMLMPKSKLVEGEDIVVEGLRRSILIPWHWKNNSIRCQAQLLLPVPVPMSGSVSVNNSESRCSMETTPGIEEGP